MVALLAATLMLIADIALRKSVGFSILGTIDITQLAVMTCVFLAMPLAFLREAHVGVDFITDGLPPRLLSLVKAMSGLVSVVMLIAIFWFSLRQAGLQFAQGDRSQTLGLPLALYWTALLVGIGCSVPTALLLVLRFGAAALRAPRPSDDG